MWFFLYFWTFPNDTFSFNLNQGLNHSNSSMYVFRFYPKLGKNHVLLLKISILHHQHHGFPIEIWWMCCATCHLGTLPYLQQKFLICTWKKFSLEFWNLAVLNMFFYVHHFYWHASTKQHRLYMFIPFLRVKQSDMV